MIMTTPSELGENLKNGKYLSQVEINHCLIKWPLDTILFSENCDTCRESEKFKLSENASEEWYLRIRVAGRGEKSRITLVSLYMTKIQQESPVLHVDLRFGLQDQNFESWSSDFHRCLSEDGEIEKVFLDINNYKHISNPMLVCEMIDRKAIWENGFEKNQTVYLLSDIKNIMESFVDIHLKMQDGEVLAYCPFLWARSLVFKEMIENSKDSSNLYIPYSTREVLSSLLPYFYLGLGHYIRNDISLLYLYEYGWLFDIPDLKKILAVKDILLESPSLNRIYKIQNILNTTCENDDLIELKLEGIEDVWRLRYTSSEEGDFNVCLELHKGKEKRLVHYDITLSNNVDICNATGEVFIGPDDIKVIAKMDNKKINMDKELAINCEFFTVTDYGKPSILSLDDDYEHLSRDLGKIFKSAFKYNMLVMSEYACVKVHSTFLRARSNYLLYLINRLPPHTYTEDLKVPGLSYTTLNNLMKFIYTGRLEDVSTEVVLEIYEVSPRLQIDGLQEACSKILECSLSTKNVLWIILLSDLYNDISLMNSAKNFIYCNSKIMVLKKWKLFKYRNSTMAREIIVKIKDKFTSNINLSNLRFQQSYS